MKKCMMIMVICFCASILNADELSEAYIKRDYLNEHMLVLKYETQNTYQQIQKNQEKISKLEAEKKAKEEADKKAKEETEKKKK